MAHPQQEQLLESALGEGIWEVGVELQFASGKPANNKFDWEKVFKHPEDKSDPHRPENYELSPAGEIIVGNLVEIVDIGAPNLLAGPPTGGQRLAMYIGRVLNVPVARFEKVPSSPGSKDFKYESARDKELILTSSRISLVEDAVTEFTSTLGLMRHIASVLAEQDPESLNANNLTPEQIIAIYAVHYRGDDKTRQNIDVPFECIIDCHVPNLITPDNPVYQKYGKLALGSL
jgi:hypothetical protein